MATLTHQKKSVRAMALHPKEHCFAFASADNIKKFNFPRGEFMHNMLSQQKTIINSMAVNEDGVLASAGDNGSLRFWNWKSGHNFQQAQTIVQPEWSCKVYPIRPTYRSYKVFPRLLEARGFR